MTGLSLSGSAVLSVDGFFDLEAADGEVPRRLLKETRLPPAAQFTRPVLSPCGKFVGVCSTKVIVYTVETGVPRRQVPFEMHLPASPANCKAIFCGSSPDSNWAAVVVGPDFHVYDLRESVCCHAFTVRNSSLNTSDALSHQFSSSILFCPRSQFLVTGLDQDDHGWSFSSVEVWNLALKERAMGKEASTKRCWATWRPDGLRLAITPHDVGATQFWNLIPQSQVGYDGFRAKPWMSDNAKMYCRSLSFSPNSRLMVYMDRFTGGAIHIADADSGVKICVYREPKYLPPPVTFSPDGRYITHFRFRSDGDCKNNAARKGTTLQLWFRHSSMDAALEDLVPDHLFPWGLRGRIGLFLPLQTLIEG